jgi:ribonuclease HIII
MADAASHTYTLTPEQGRALQSILKERLFEFSPLAYGHFSAKRGKCSVNYYQSGKVTIQGKDAREFIEFAFEPMVLGEARLGYEEELHPERYSPHFGVDEAGKGDFYGPLVIAGAYVDPALARQLVALGVKDSKSVGGDKRIAELAEGIRGLLGRRCSVVKIGPKAYNRLYSRFRNLNRLLAWGHAQVIENLKAAVPSCPRALSDQFAHPRLIEQSLERKKVQIVLEQRTKAESDPAVAAASILARDSFVAALDQLGERFGGPLPKGAGAPVKTHAASLFQQHGLEALASVAKTHFKTYAEITGIPAPHRPGEAEPA